MAKYIKTYSTNAEAIADTSVKAPNISFSKESLQVLTGGHKFLKDTPMDIVDNGASGIAYSAPEDWVITYTTTDGGLLTLAGTEFGGLTVTAHTYSGGVGTICLNGPLVTVSANAFVGNTKLETISFPESLVSMGAACFSGCTSLESVSLSSSLTEIGDSAFYGCSSLESIDIPSTMVSIPNYCFYDCTSLAMVSIPKSLRTIGSAAFHGTAIQTIHLNNVNVIANGTFESCTSLTGITIPEGVTELSREMFDGCSQLSSVSLPNSLLYIRTKAFTNCPSLTVLTIPKNVEIIEDDFMTNGNIGVIVSEPLYPPTLLESTALSSVSNIIVNKQSIGLYKEATNWALYGNKIIGELVVNKVYYTSLSQSVVPANTGATYGTDCRIASNVYSVEERRGTITFEGIPTIIPENMFLASSDLQSVIIPDAIETIAQNAFAGCTFLNKVVISRNVTTLGGGNIFNGCVRLREVVIEGDSALVGIDYPASVVMVEVPYQLVGTYRGIYSDNHYMFRPIVYNNTIVYNADQQITIDPTLFGDAVLSRSEYYSALNIGIFYFKSNVVHIESRAIEGSSLKEIYFPDSLMVMEYDIFHTNDLGYMESMGLGSETIFIGGEILRYPVNMVLFTCKALNVPQLGAGNTFGSSTEIKVYKEVSTDYAAAPNWSAYSSQIIGM